MRIDDTDTLPLDTIGFAHGATGRRAARRSLAMAELAMAASLLIGILIALTAVSAFAA